METEDCANPDLVNFKERHMTGAFLCRYQNCPRAAQGFNTSVLRQKHEESHRPRFQCTHAPCGFFGTTFNTRRTMRRHAQQYHDEEDTGSVPNSLTTKPRVLREDRSLFSFTREKTKRRIEDITPQDDIEVATRGISGNGEITIARSISPYVALKQPTNTMSDIYGDDVHSPAMIQAAPGPYANQTIAGSNHVVPANPRQLSRLKYKAGHGADTVSREQSPFREATEYSTTWCGNLNPDLESFRAPVTRTFPPSEKFLDGYSTGNAEMASFPPSTNYEASSKDHSDRILLNAELATDEYSSTLLSHPQQAEEYVINCVCGFSEDDGNTVQCDSCETWQHTECYYLDKHGNVPTKEELVAMDHFCVRCRP